MLLPDQPGSHPRLALSAGKNETIHVVDRDNMGHYNPNNDNQIVQSLVNIFPNGTPEPGNYNAPVYLQRHGLFWTGERYVDGVPAEQRIAAR